jgi:DNA topoisomerase II
MLSSSKGSKFESKLVPGDVKPHVSMVISCRLPNPNWTSQSKTKLARPKPILHVDPTRDGLSGIRRWNLSNRLIAAIDAKNYKALSKTDGKSKKRIVADAGEDANEAGGPNSSNCIFTLIEGISAAPYSKERNTLNGGKDRNGHLPLRGKFLNVTDAPPLQIAENNEICLIKRYLGLREGVDYRDPEARKELRYGFILIIADADSDGSHIKALVLNFFHVRFPSIIALGMFGALLTPVVRCVSSNGSILQRFYTTAEFVAWRSANPNVVCDVKYYKGLGTSKDSDIQDDLHTAPIIVCVYDNPISDSFEMMDVAFNPKRAEDRKAWIIRWRDAVAIDDVRVVGASVLIKSRPITRILNTELVAYTIDALYRAIPSYRDGLKKVQRQALWYALTSFDYGKKKQTVRVLDFASAASVAVHYHHGDMSDAIIKMAQCYPGSNNMAYFYQDGQFGTRDTLGNDAPSARYPKTALNKWVSRAFFADTIALIPQNTVEDEVAEPKWLPCILPMHLINGTRGIATGWGTFIPSHNPKDVAAWILERMRGTPAAAIPEPTPWYRDFTGTVSIVERSPGAQGAPEAPGAPEPEPDESLPGDEPESIPAHAPAGAPSRRSLRTEGVFVVTGTRKHATNGEVYDVLITELPIGHAFTNYRKFLELLEANKQLSTFRDASSSKVPRYELRGLAFKPTIVSLRLRRTQGLNSMILINDEGRPRPYSRVRDILEDYYISMLQVFEQLIVSWREECKQRIVTLRERIQFVTLVAVEGKIGILNVPRAEVYTQMDAHGLSRHHYTKMGLNALSRESIPEMQAQVLQGEERLRELEALRPEAVWTQRLQTLMQQGSL